jgi:serpin B
MAGLAILGAIDAGGPAVAAPVSVAQANNAFAFDLYGELSKTSGNLFFSPNSIETALAMTYSGARGDTATQMGAVLHLPATGPELNKSFRNLLMVLNGADGKPRGYELSVANALWGQRGYPFLPDFTGILRDDYGAGLESLNFQQDAEGSRKTINNWVAKATRQKITDLVQPGALSAATRLVLTNAIYFEGVWANTFEKEATHEEPFHITATEDKKVSLMNQTERFGYAEDDGFQALQLPYKEHKSSMIILLPRAVDGLPAIEKELLAGALTKLKFVDQKVEVTIPKFTMTQEIGLGPVLLKMGMRDAFTPAADFSGMDGKRDLYLSAVIHKAYVQVDETGTKAAAATAAVMSLAMARPIAPPPVFRADHPFIFLIQEDTTGTILFMGRVAQP